MKPTIQRAAAVSVGLSALFLVAYGGATATTARRTTPIASFHFGWERHVPFVAPAIVPYMSIDLFFVVAPFLLQSETELRAHVRRVTLAIVVACSCFVIMPLRFSFARPKVSGALGVVFDQFQRADLPFNQLPSLHVALLLIVGEVFLRRARRGLRFLLAVWFALVAVSPLVVYQHHAADLLTGFALGLVCLSLFPFESRGRAFERNYRVATNYLAGALILVAASIAIGRASWPLWWPTLSLLMVAIGYAFAGPSIYGKRDDGTLPWRTRLLYWPTMLGQRASWMWYARRCDAYNVLVPGRLWIGRRLNDREARAAIDAGVTTVIDLTAEHTEARPFRRLPCLHLPTLDLTAPSGAQVQDALAFIDRQRGGVVYVHCKVGYSRTAVIAAAHPLASGVVDSPDAAIAVLRAARPTIIIRPEAMRACRGFRTSGHTGTADLSR